ncbi:MAG: hypothetical protein KatS3mg030_545 [Saprospiraceae bacterium]|nr:MAG: hypothetical protein KatS3mg030_545 [Saprospiraceae bacterium]
MNKLFTLLLLTLWSLALGAQTIILGEHFEDSGIPAGWTQQTNASDGGWKTGTAAALSSQFFPIPSNGTRIAATNDDGCNCDKNTDRLILPKLDLSAYSAVSISFDLFFAKGSYQGKTESAWLQYSIDDGTTWTNLVEFDGDGDKWRSFRISLEPVVGDSSVLLAFTYSDGGGWLFGCAIDNVVVAAPPSHDVAITGLDVPRYTLFGTGVTLSGEVTNLGSDTLTSFTLSWSDGINIYTDQVTGLQVPFLGSAPFSHSTPLMVPQAKTYGYTLSVSEPNGADDANMADNEMSGKVSGLIYIPTKKVVGEEGTGTWCGWCPRGTDWMDYMPKNYPDQWIGIAVHNGDPMAVSAYDNGLGFTGFPGAKLDRAFEIDPSEFEDYWAEFADRIVPVAPMLNSAVLDVASMTLTVEASSEFLTEMDDVNMRMSVVLTEDGVHGTSSGYNQVNYYSGEVDPLPGYGYDWKNLPDPVPAAQMTYDHVGRDLLGGFSGMAGSIPSSVMASQVVEQTFTRTNFNKSWNPFNMHAVLLVIDASTGTIVNANKTELEVICPADFGAQIQVTDSSPTELGSINVTPPSPLFGFGGYTYLWSTGETTKDISGLQPGVYTLVITDKIGCSQTIEVTVGGVSQADEIRSLQTMVLTPNPASGETVLVLEFDETVDARISLLNTLGQTLQEQRLDGIRATRLPIDLSNLSEGTYLVRVQVGNQFSVRRLVINR